MNNTTNLHKLTAETLPEVTWGQVRVVTTDLLAQLYGTASSNIHDNYRKNSDRFVAEKHFYKLTGSSLKTFVSLLPENFRSQISSKVRTLILWTERGAARHAKMLDTDEAWDVFEKLEDCYFRVKAVMEAKAYSVNREDVLTKHQADILRDMLKTAIERLPAGMQASAMIQGWSKLKSHFGVPYRQIPQAEYAEAVSLVARHITVLEGELLPPEPKVTITFQMPELKIPELENRVGRSGWLTFKELFNMSQHHTAPVGVLLHSMKEQGYNVTPALVEYLGWRHIAEIQHNRIKNILDEASLTLRNGLALTFD